MNGVYHLSDQLMHPFIKCNPPVGIASLAPSRGLPGLPAGEATPSPPHPARQIYPEGGRHLQRQDSLYTRPYAMARFGGTGAGGLNGMDMPAPPLKLTLGLSLSVSINKHFAPPPNLPKNKIVPAPLARLHGYS